MADLLGSGTAGDEGKNFVAEAVKSMENVRADMAALLAVDSKPAGLETILESQWTKLEMALDTVFGTDSDAQTDPTSAVRTTAPRKEDILDDIDDILNALSSGAAFVAATAGGGGGEFESQALGSGAASDAFNRVMWSADATMGMTGSTRHGTALRKKSENAKGSADTEVYGAFSYSTMQQTVRTADAVSLTGIAIYSGGLAWQHNFADVDRIVLDDATLLRNATWSNTTGANATVLYATNSGLLRPVNNITNTFAGILLGQGAGAGSEANGTWSVGTAGGSGYLMGGFGVMHVADTARPARSGDDGSAATAQLFSMVANVDPNDSSASITDGMFAVRGRHFGWVDADSDPATDMTHVALTDNKGTTATDDDTNVQYTAKFDLAELASLGGAHKAINGPKWVDGVVATLTKERDLLSTLQGLNSADTQAAELLAWQRVQDAVQFNLFGGQTPVKLNEGYADLDSEADAIDLINRALDALSSKSMVS